MKKRLLTLLMLGLSVGTAYAADDTPSSAPAQPDRDTYYSSGYLLGINLGMAEIKAPDLTGYSKQDKGFYGRAYFGYNINHYLGVQVGYVYLPPVKYTASNSPNIKINETGYDGLLTAKYPLGEGFALFANGGGAFVSADQSQSNGDLSQNALVWAYGGGLDYVFANIGGLHMNLDYYHTDQKNMSTLNIPAIDAISLGVYYQF